MHLRDRGGADRLSVESVEQLSERRSSAARSRPGSARRGGRQASCSSEVARRFLPDEIRPGRERLAELDRRGPDLWKAVA
jgi:hypothetical protein